MPQSSEAAVKPRKGKLSLWLDVELRRRLKVEAAMREVTIQDFVGVLIVRELESVGPPPSPDPETRD